MTMSENLDESSTLEGVEIPDELLDAIAGGFANVDLAQLTPWLAFAKEKGFAMEFALGALASNGFALADGFADRLASIWNEI